LPKNSLPWITSFILVGDLHLPLHVGFLDDLGGTKTKVTFQGKTQTLHELWDAGMLDTENEHRKQWRSYLTKA
jgi:S1/P1 Nuclease